MYLLCLKLQVTLQIISPTSGQVITQTDETRFEAIAFDTRTEINNGANIAYVTFRIYDSAGQLVYERIENIVRYCAGWGDTTCDTLDWLFDTPGTYTMTVQATTNTGLQSEVITRSFTITAPVEETRLDDNIRARALVPELAQTVIPLPTPTDIPEIDGYAITRQSVHYGYDELNRLDCAAYYDEIDCIGNKKIVK